MLARQASMALAFVAALSFAGPPASAGAAQDRGRARSGGGHAGRSSSGAVRSGGQAARSYSGRSHAVPRGTAPGRSYRVAPGRSDRGGSAIARHPRPGSGLGRYGRSSRSGRGFSGSYRGFGSRYYGSRYYGGYYRPYRGYSYGWPAFSWWPSLSFRYYASPYYDYGYYDSPSSVGYVIDESPGAPRPDDYAGYDDAGYDDRRPAYDTPTDADTGRLLLVITPSDATIYVDDDYWGEGRDTRSITLRSGAHTIEVVRPGFMPVRRSFVVARGQTSELRLDLPRP